MLLVCVKEMVVCVNTKYRSMSPKANCLEFRRVLINGCHVGFLVLSPHSINYHQISTWMNLGEAIYTEPPCLSAKKKMFIQSSLLCLRSNKTIHSTVIDLVACSASDRIDEKGLFLQPIKFFTWLPCKTKFTEKHVKSCKRPVKEVPGKHRNRSLVRSTN